MLPKEYRLHGRLQKPFDISIDTPLFTVIIKKNDLQNNRYGFVISKKIDKRAVIRNACKRKLSQCLQNLADKIRTGYDMLFLARKPLVIQDQSQVCMVLSEAFEKKGLLA